jgi:uncharacterized protein
MKKAIKKAAWLLLTGLLLLNLVAALHAWKFTHFSPEATERIKPEQLSIAGKLNALAFGVDLPRPINDSQPSQPFETVSLQAEKQLETWHIKADSAKGTVILFHGYGGKKSGMLDKSAEFLRMGYSTLLVDFRGSGGSEGEQTTIGYEEAEEVKASFDFLKSKGEKNIVLFGTSMGAVAIMKAMHDYQLDAQAAILECPFGTMYETTCARFRAMGVTTVPLAHILMFWGGTLNGFWAFSHNPVEYAKSIHCPTLLLYGEQDARVSKQETVAIFDNLAGKKSLKTYPLAGHENYLLKYRNEWVVDVSGFLEQSHQFPK